MLSFSSVTANTSPVTAEQFQQTGEDFTLAGDLTNQAYQLARLGRYEDAERLHSRSLQLKVGSVGRQHPSVATSYNGLGEAQLKLGRLDEAEVNLRTAITFREAFGQRFEAACSKENLAQVYEMRGDLAQAKDFRKQWGGKEFMVCSHYDCPHSTTFPFNELRACSRCKVSTSIYYCSIDCQVCDWKRHKRYCKEQ
ncbi:hypothetical protein OBBRIDRAFT_718976 [Obba rivulosa]|uniref:MYND-type domain-containing protein n=1 Tax=Obba rivulosa TaxID=1052685 RepID=A0A8E2DUX7_9APHY|nr:hypothetical protein OBBRIDRAFT_718976 [Obba rivulosa]